MVNLKVSPCRKVHPSITKRAFFFSNKSSDVRLISDEFNGCDLVACFSFEMCFSIKRWFFFQIILQACVEVFTEWLVFTEWITQTKKKSDV